MKRRNKKVVYCQRGKKDRKEAGRSAAKPRAGHNRGKKKEQKRVRENAFKRQAQSERRRNAQQRDAMAGARGDSRLPEDRSRSEVEDNENVPRPPLHPS